MPSNAVIRPVPFPKAFGATTNAAVLSQAAQLLLLGIYLRADDRVLEARAAATKRTKRVRLIAALPQRDLQMLKVPRLRPTGERFHTKDVQARLAQRYGISARKKVTRKRSLRFPLLKLAQNLKRDPTPRATAELMEAALRHPKELPRVAAAASYFELSAEPSHLLKVLVKGTRSNDKLVRDVAATALARLAPEHPRLFELTQSVARENREIEKVSDTKHPCMLIHGTFAKREAWWQPGGDFHTYVRSAVCPGLYSAKDRFGWSGAYSDGARLTAGAELRDWVSRHGLDGLDLFAHSHGGSVSMIASQGGLNIGKLVLLSCPVHVPKYLPDFKRVQKVFSLHVHMDLVILADGGGLRYRHPDITEKVLPVWFYHSDTHDPSTWRKYNIRDWLS